MTESHHVNGASTGLLDRSDVFEALAEIRRPVAVVASPDGPRPVLLDGSGALTPELMRQSLLAILPALFPGGWATAVSPRPTACGFRTSSGRWRVASRHHG